MAMRGPRGYGKWKFGEEITGRFVSWDFQRLLPVFRVSDFGLGGFKEEF